MKTVTGFFILLLHLALGNAVSELIGHFIPGSVIGMILLFLSLLTGLVKDSQIRLVATFLTDNMTVFFLPAFMGIMELWGMIRMNLAAWIAVVFLTTVLVLFAAGGTQEMVERFSARRRRPAEGTDGTSSNKKTEI